MHYCTRNKIRLEGRSGRVGCLAQSSTSTDAGTVGALAPLRLRSITALFCPHAIAHRTVLHAHPATLSV